MKKRLSLSIFAVLLSLIATSLLTACGGTSSDKITLSYWIWDKNQAPAVQTIADDFHKANPNISVDVEVTPYKNHAYFTKLETAITGGKGPDVFWMNGPNFVKYASNGVLQPLDDQLKTDNVSLSNYPQALVDLYSWNGKHYALPKDFDTIGLWYNKALFDAAGVKYPDTTWTWDTLTTAAKKLSDPKKGVFGIGAAMDSQQNFYNTILQNGGYIISPDKKKSGYDDPASVGGLKFWTDLIHAGASPSEQAMADTDPFDLFESGKIAMYYGGSWDAIAFAQNAYTKDKVDVAVLPQGKQRATVIHGLGNVVNAKSAHPQEAAKFAEYLGSRSAAEIQAKTGTVIPAYNGSQTAWINAYPTFHVQIYLDELAYAYPYPVSKNTGAWNQAETDILTKVWSGQLSVQDGTTQLAARMNQELAQE